MDPKNEIVMRIMQHTKTIAETYMAARGVRDPYLQAQIIEQLATDGVALARACAALFVDIAKEHDVAIPAPDRAIEVDPAAN